MPGKKTGLSKEVAFSLTLVLWAAAAWALYPLVDIDNVDMGNVKTYLYRSAMGVTILVIFFGKTLHDLIFPWVTSRTIPRWRCTCSLRVRSSLLPGMASSANTRSAWTRGSIFHLRSRL